MALLLEITKADGSVTRTPLQSQATKVGAWPGGKVKVVDSATGKAPAGISAKKVGDSLVVDNLPEGKTVEITKFYTDCSPATPCSLVIDPADGGQAAAITQTSAPVAALADNQALMYGPASGAGAAAAVAGIPTSVIVGGLALVGLAAAGGGGGGSSSSTTPTPPPAPTDTTAPAAPTLALVAGSDSGTAGDGITSDGTPTVRVTLAGTGATAPVAGDTVKLYVGSTQVGSAVLSASDITAGYVDVTATSLGADGAKTLTATVTDASGNASVLSGGLAITVDSTAPAAPALALVAGSDSGTLGDGITSDGTPTVRVTLAGAGATAPVAGDTVKLYSGATEVGSAVLSGSDITAGHVDVTAASLGADGVKTLTATVIDAAANTSVASGGLAVTLDSAAPAAPTLALTAGSDSGTVGDGITNDGTPTIRVTLAGAGAAAPVAGDTVKLFSGATQVGSAVLSGSDITAGHVDVTATSLGADGAKTLTATVTDAAGNAGAASAALPITLATATVLGDLDDLVTGSAGNDALIGGTGGSVRNYQFEYWNTANAGAYQDGTADYTAFTSTALNGWSIGATASSITAGAGPGVEQFTGGPMELTSNLVATPFYADETGGGGRWHWDTVFDDGTGGASISQTVDTVAGATYHLEIQLSKLDNDSSLSVWWGGTELTRYDGLTNGTTGTAPGIFDLSESRQVWSWIVEGPVGATSATLEIRGYETLADGLGTRIDRITLDPVVTDNSEDMVGAAGNDLLFGQDGNDLLYGGAQGDTAATADGVADGFVYSLRAANGNDVIADFQVGVDRIFLVDALDTSLAGSLLPGAADDGTHTTDADSNLSFADFVQGSSASQYLTVTDDGSGWVKLSFFGQSVTGTATALGSVELDGVAYGAGAGQYDTVEELFTAGVLDATMDGFHVGLLTNVV